MGRSFRAGHHAELEDSVADPFNKNPPFRGLKLYVKDLDSNTLPPFLARLCDPDKPCSYSEEEVLCVFETAAEVHGYNIVPHISQIVSTVIIIMSSVTGSLHSVGCSKVISALSRYVIDPMGTEEEKSVTLEPYGRSLIRSGLRILDESTKASNSQMIISSIQMIHSIMISLDVSIISSEISNIIHAMEQLRGHSMPEISTPAFQAAEIAKKFCRQEEGGYGKRAGPLANYGGRHVRRGSYSHSVMDDVDIRDGGSNESLSDDVQSVHRFRDYDSHPSYSGIPGSARARRRLWSNGSEKSRGLSNDDFPDTAIRDSYDGVGVLAQSNSAGLVKSVRRYSDLPTRIADPCPTCLTPRATNRCSQISRRGALSGDVRMQSTPRKQLQFYNSCSDSKREGYRLPDSPALRQIRRCSGQRAEGELEERNGCWDSIQHDSQCHVQNTNTSIEDMKLPNNGEHSDNAGKSPFEERQPEKEMTRGKKGNKNCSSTPFFLFLCALVIVVLLLAWCKEDRKELYVVPT